MATSTSSISGLASGIDTATMVTQLMQIEAQPQTLLKTRLTNTNADAAAYRDINTSFAALATAAAAFTGEGGVASARSATSSSATATATAGATAVTGSSVTFAVNRLAATQVSVSKGEWSSKTAPVRDQQPGWPLTVLDENGASVGTIDVPAGATLTDAAAAINKSGLGLSATVVQLDTNKFRLQVASSTPGAAGAFTLQGAGETAANAGGAFSVTAQGQDAEIDLGGGLLAHSSSNTFSELVTGVSVTVSAVSATPTTVSVGTDTKAITDKMQALVTAANAVLTKIGKYTDSANGDAAVLKGDFNLSQLAQQVLSTVSTAVGTAGSPSAAGLQLTRDGALSFDATAFQTTLAANPTLVQNLLGGSLGAGKDGKTGTADDAIAVDGVAARLQQLAQRASDSTSGTLVMLAKSEDTQASDLQEQIDSWDLRLQLRQETLTARFTAMETALSTLKSQGDWLSSQLSSLPSWNSDKSS